MDKLSRIFHILDKENIILEDLNISNKSTSGVYFYFPNTFPVIALSKSLLNNQKKYISVLSEELGHHFTTTGDLTIKSKNYQEKLYKNKKELLAKRWGANFLITDEEFVQALHACIISIPEMSEYFDVTEDIIKLKINSILCNEDKYNSIRTNFMQHEVPYNACTI